MRVLVLIAALCLVPFPNALGQNTEAGQTIAVQDLFATPCGVRGGGGGREGGEEREKKKKKFLSYILKRDGI